MGKGLIRPGCLCFPMVHVHFVRFCLFLLNNFHHQLKCYLMLSDSFPYVYKNVCCWELIIATTKSFFWRTDKNNHKITISFNIQDFIDVINTSEGNVCLHMAEGLDGRSQKLLKVYSFVPSSLFDQAIFTTILGK